LNQLQHCLCEIITMFKYNNTVVRVQQKYVSIKQNSFIKTIKLLKKIIELFKSNKINTSVD